VTYFAAKIRLASALPHPHFDPKTNINPAELWENREYREQIEITVPTGKKLRIQADIHNVICHTFYEYRLKGFGGGLA